MNYDSDGYIYSARQEVNGKLATIWFHKEPPYLYHRTDAPTIVFDDGETWWYIQGKHISEFNNIDVKDIEKYLILV